MSKIATRQNHVSIQAMLFEPEELTHEPEIFHTPKKEDKRFQELLSRLFHVTSEDPRNFNILYLKLCKKLTFPDIAREPCLDGMDEDSVRHRFTRCTMKLFGN